MANDEEAQTRKSAVTRSWICPGAGFALIGRQAFAAATFAATILMAPALAWLAFRPSAASLGLSVAVVVMATALWLAEQVAIKRAAIGTPGPAFLVGGFVASSCLMWLAILVALGLFLTSFGSLRMAGAGMSPTLENSERLVYHKHGDALSIKPGAVVVFKNAQDSRWGEPGWIVIARVLAGPGDTLSIHDARYVVNGVTGPPVTQIRDYESVLDVPPSPESITVPKGRYFIVFDSPTSGLDSRAMSWVRAENILGSQAWYLSSRGILKRVE